MRKIILLLTFICLQLSLVASQIAEEAPTPILPPTEEELKGPVFPMGELAKKNVEDNSKFMTEFVNMLATLGLIIASMLIIAWFLKRLVNTRIEKVNSSSLIKILDKRSLSPKAVVYLLEVEGTGYLIAESATSVTRIAEFPIEKEG